MKKSLLFVMNNLRCGGAEKSLVTLLNCIDYSKYEVDLFLFEHSGEFVYMLPKTVNLLQSPKYWGILNGPIRTSISLLIKDLRFDLVFSRIMQTIICRTFRSSEKSEQYLWKSIRKAFTPFEKNYDVAIGYLEKNPIYFTADMVKAKMKMGWIHTNYSMLKHDWKYENNYFSKLHHIITVSEECAKELKRLFPLQSIKVKVVENIILPLMINKMAEEITVDRDATQVELATVARLDTPKGIDIALIASHMLRQDGYKFKWRILGEGQQRRELEDLIRRYNLENMFVLEGNKVNPYPYIKNTTIYIQPSRYEGKSIAVEEAKVLKKPIVVTNFGTVRDQIINEVNGLIVDTNAEALYRGIKRLLDDPTLQEKLSSNLTGQHFENMNEIEKLYGLIEGYVV